MPQYLVTRNLCTCTYASKLVQTPPTSKKSVAVIGGGAAGLVAARELRLLNHNVTVFEQASDVGGVWVYDPQTERMYDTRDGVTQQNKKRKVHSSMYKSLRTNLPREIMAFSDFPFHPEIMKGRSIDDRRYPCHQEVLAYLQAFAQHYDLLSMIKFNSQIESVSAQYRPSGQNGNSQELEWKLEVIDTAKGNAREQMFDAVVVCNGHYSCPHLPVFEGAEHFKGKQIHSHDYRTPDEFEDERVLVIGKGPSGVDISFEVATVADKVYISARNWKQMSSEAINERNNLFQKDVIRKFIGDRNVALSNGEILEDIDTVLYCTGYDFSFPFFKDTKFKDALVDVESGIVMPLYQKMFTPEYGKYLAFIGLPFRIVPFPLFEFQCKWLAYLLADKCAPLPSQEQMRRSLQEEITREFLPKQDATKQFYNMDSSQFAYIDWLADQCEEAQRLPHWREEIFHATRPGKYSHPETYRDHWTDFGLIETVEKFNTQLIQQIQNQQIQLQSTKG